MDFGPANIKFFESSRPTPDKPITKMLVLTNLIIVSKP